MQKENGSVHLGGEKHAKDAEAAKLKELPVKILNVHWLVMLVHSPDMSPVLNTTYDFSFRKRGVF